MSNKQTKQDLCVEDFMTASSCSRRFVWMSECRQKVQSREEEGVRTRVPPVGEKRGLCVCVFSVS